MRKNDIYINAKKRHLKLSFPEPPDQFRPDLGKGDLDFFK